MFIVWRRESKLDFDQIDRIWRMCACARCVWIWWMLAHVLVACIIQINHYSAPNKKCMAIQWKEKKNNWNRKHSIDFRIIRMKLFILGDFSFSCRLRVENTLVYVGNVVVGGYIRLYGCLPCKNNNFIWEVFGVQKKTRTHHTTPHQLFVMQCKRNWIFYEHNVHCTMYT